MAATVATESQLQKLFATGDNYDRWLAYLKSVRPKYVGTPMLAKIDATIASGEAKKSSLTKTMQAARAGWNWLLSEGAGAWDSLKSYVGLGFLPAVPVAAWWVGGITATAILGAIGVMNNWINTEAATTKAAMDQYDSDFAAAKSSGMSDAEALKLATQKAQGRAAAAKGAASADDSGDGKSFGEKLADNAGKIGMAALAAFVLWKIADKKGWI